MTAELPNLRHLRAFTAICDLGTLADAARAIHLSQPALSQAMARLENSLGAQLFTRTRRGMYPTRAGTLLRVRANRARTLLQDAARTRRVADSLSAVQLRALVGLAAHGSFAVAARALGVSQPALNRAAAEVEALYGQKLYRASPRGADLTPTGQALARAARLAFGELAQARDEIAALQGTGDGHIRLGSLPLSRGTLLPPALNALTAQFPSAAITVTENPFAEMLHALRNGDLDMMLGALRTPPPAEDVAQEQLFLDRMGIYARPGHPLSDTRPTRQTLAAASWIVARRDSPSRAAFDAYFHGLDVAPSVEANAMNLVQGLLEGSDKLAMMSAVQAAPEIARGSLQRLDVTLNDPPRPIGVTTRRDWQPTALQAAFLRILRDEAARLAPAT